eukprot:gene6715-10880_t
MQRYCSKAINLPKDVQRLILTKQNQFYSKKLNFSTESYYQNKSSLNPSMYSKLEIYDKETLDELTKFQTVPQMTTYFNFENFDFSFDEQDDEVDFEVDNFGGPKILEEENIPEEIVEEEILHELSEFEKEELLFRSSFEGLQKYATESEKLLFQEKLERKSVQDAIDKYRILVKDATERGEGVNLPPAKKIVLEWFEPLKEEIKSFQKKAHLQDMGEPQGHFLHVSNYITLLDADKLAILTIHELLGSTLKEKVYFKEIAKSLGTTISAEYNYQKLKSVPYGTHNLSKSVFDINKRAQQFFEQEKLEEGQTVWSATEIINVGSFLIDIALRNCIIPNFGDKTNGPIELEGEKKFAFTHGYEFKDSKKYGFIDVDDDIRKLISDEHSMKELHLLPRYVPMLVKPKPWKSYNSGGYLLRNHLMMRTRGSKVQSFVLQDALLEDVLAGLNVLNDTSWRINKDVFKIFLQVWEEGGGLGELPSRHDEPIPPNPHSEDVRSSYQWKKLVERVKVNNRNLHSRRCDTMYKIQVAKDFVNENFYYPHNVDFRGRSYPIPPHLNHLGADMNRGLLIFDKGLPIGVEGIKWLKIHLANLCGEDKRSFEDRIKWIDDNFEKVKDSAMKPLEGKRWWLESENPWQTLAACIELVNCDNDPNFISHIPVQMDGSCNGLQHYAALGRDNLGALHVNLIPSERPMDVYSGVLAVVNKHLENDSKNGVELAKELVGKVVRSTIKQTVMTSVYGVTFVGARKQIFKRLRERNDIMEESLIPASIYLAKLTFKSLGEVFHGAYNIMNWLNECAYLISSENSPVMWITPLGLPIVQPYRAISTKRIKTIVQSVLLASQDDELPISRDRQMSAFPPNYVHSLDASHMLMTSKKCKKLGIEFASVHDSFWTHASSIDQLNITIREEFLKLHSQPLLETLLSSFEQSYPHVKFPKLPEKGNLDVSRVLESKYFFD